MNGLCELLEMLFEFYRKEDWFNEHNICRCGLMQRTVWNCGNSIGRLLIIGSPP